MLKLGGGDVKIKSRACLNKVEFNFCVQINRTVRNMSLKFVLYTIQYIIRLQRTSKKSQISFFREKVRWKHTGSYLKETVTTTMTIYHDTRATVIRTNHETHIHI